MRGDLIVSEAGLHHPGAGIKRIFVITKDSSLIEFDLTRNVVIKLNYGCFDLPKVNKPELTTFRADWVGGAVSWPLREDSIKKFASAEFEVFANFTHKGANLDVDLRGGVEKIKLQLQELIRLGDDGQVGTFRVQADDDTKLELVN